MGRRISRHENSRRSRPHHEYEEQNSSIGLVSQSKSDSIRMGYFEPIDPEEIKIRKLIKAKTYGQSEMLKSLLSNCPISVCIGPAGCGKTFLSVYSALRRLQSGQAERIIITRPAVESDEQLGFLPGGVDSKMLPFVMPILDCFVDLVGGRTTNLMIEKGVLSIRPFAFMRGSTFSNAFIIADEMSNSTPSQMKCLITRAGENSKTAILGDPRQSDLKGSQNGLIDFKTRLQNFSTELVTLDELTEKDVVRSEVVRQMVELYEDQQPVHLRAM